jgi:glycine/D-amino acid oxidase-like deaminating enzyme
MTPDGLPIIGRDPEWPSLLYACGHSRNGILMGPLTADCIAAVLRGDSTPAPINAFGIARFDVAERAPRLAGPATSAN